MYGCKFTIKKHTKWFELPIREVKAFEADDFS